MTASVSVEVGADVRAAALVTQMTLEEKIGMVTANRGWPVNADGSWVRDPGVPAMEPPPPPGAIGSDAFVPGVPRLGIPALHMCGAGAGLVNMGGQRPDGVATAFPSPLAQAATWDTQTVYDFGGALAREALDHGINTLLAGACNLTVEARCGRAFEYHGEDPILAGRLVGAELRGTQDQGVIATIKHFAANFQETARYVVDSVVSERALREGELLVFELAIAESGVGAVMAAYNKVNGTWSCESSYLLNEVLKGEWGFPGWVMSDFHATHSTVESAMAGLDQECPVPEFFGAKLAEAVESGAVPIARLDDMVRRIVRTMIAVGLVDKTALPDRADPAAIAATAQLVAERSLVLLRNDGVLPLSKDAALSIVLIGGHADVAVRSGGGSSEVDPIGGDPLWTGPARRPFPSVVWIPSSPLEAVRSRNAAGTVSFCSGADVAEAVAAARAADVAIVFATQWATECVDLAGLSLPDKQDDLVRAVAAANPRTVVVLETGGAVLMPWVDDVAAILEAWYPGQRGAEAIADVLFGAVDPSGRLPITFPRSEADLPRPLIDPIPLRAGCQQPPGVLDPRDDFEWLAGEYRVRYDEDLALGYKWFDSQGIEPAFCFGHGLSYTTFQYSDLAVAPRQDGVIVQFTVMNTGVRAGVDVSQIYAGLPAELGEPPRRLVGWARTELAPGQARRIEIVIPSKFLATWNVAAKAWEIADGAYEMSVGASSRDLRLHALLAWHGEK